MSFGFSISDFITLCQMVTKIRKDFSQAPSQFKSISEELRNFSIAAQDVDVAVAGCELSAQQEARLQRIGVSCKGLLSDLEKETGKYKNLQPGSNASNRSARRLWDRLRWEPDDIRDIRLRIISMTSLLNTVLGGLASQAALDMKAAVDRLVKESDGQVHGAICDWITLVDNVQYHNDHVSRQHPESCQWLLQSSAFQEWRQTPKQTLCCYGIPGAGKTILSSIVIEQLVFQFHKSNNDVGIAYIYCSSQRGHEQRFGDLLASLLRQLIEKQPSTPDMVKLLYQEHQPKGSRPSINQLSETLQSVLASYSRAFVVIDALDECSTLDGCQTRFIDSLLALQAGSRANLFLTSRSSSPDIAAKLAGIPEIQVRADPEDVKSYLAEQMYRLPGFVNRDPLLQEEIQSGIVKAVDGMFQLARFHLEDLIGARSPKAIRTAVQNLPHGSSAYDLSYEKAMQRINAQPANQGRLAREVLSWIVHAKQQLSSQEIQHALGVTSQDSEFDDTNCPEIGDIISACAGLVAVTGETGMFGLVHHTIYEYLQRTRRRWFPTAEADISSICVAYLSLCNFENGPCRTDQEFNKRLQSYPFFAYAAQNWGHHTRIASISNPRIIRFLTTRPLVEASTQALFAASDSSLLSQLDGLHVEADFRPVSQPSQWYPLQRISMRRGLTLVSGLGDNSSQYYPQTTSCMHLAAYFGIAEVAAELIELGIDMDSQDEWDSRQKRQGRWHTPYGGQTPLSWAARNGHAAVAELLLRSESVQVDSRDSSARTPLSWAAEKGHESVARLLLSHGANAIPKTDEWGRAPLTWAAGSGHGAIVSLLLSKGAEIDLMDKATRTSLSWAAGHGHEDTVSRLLTRHARIDACDKCERTPLSFAAENGRVSVVRLLLLQGADIDSKDIHGQTPLSYAAEYGWADVVSLLLARKPHLESKSGFGMRTMEWCAVYGDMLPISWAVRIGGQTPLNRAAEVGHDAVVRLLLDGGADIDSEDEKGKTVLAHAAENGHLAVLQLLVERGADIESSKVVKIVVRTSEGSEA